MITQEQLDVLRKMLSVRQPDVVKHQDPEIRQAFAKQADALAAAIATIERLPVTKDKCHIALGDDVYLSPHGTKVTVAAMDTKTGRREMLVAFGTDDRNPRQVGLYRDDEHAYSTAAAARGEVGGG